MLTLLADEDNDIGTYVIHMTANLQNYPNDVTTTVIIDVEVTPCEVIEATLTLPDMVYTLTAQAAESDTLLDV